MYPQRTNAQSFQDGAKNPSTSGAGCETSQIRTLKHLTPFIHDRFFIRMLQASLLAGKGKLTRMLDELDGAVAGPYTLGTQLSVADV